MDGSYYTLLATLIALQSQFMIFMEDRAGLTTDTNVLENPRTGLAYNKLMRVLDQLTDIEEQSLELEENLRRTMIEIIRSRDRTSLRRTDIMNLQRRLENLQADVRTAIRNLSGNVRSIGNNWRRTHFRTMLVNKKKKQVKTGFPPRVRSLPNILSILFDQDFFSDFLKTSKSENRSINFKEGQINEQLQTLDIILNDLERHRIIRTLRNLDKTFSLPDLTTHLHRPKQRLFEEEIEDELFDCYLSSPQGLLREPVLQDREENVNRSESQHSTQQHEEDSDDDQYSYSRPLSIRGLLREPVLQDREENVNRSESQHSTQQHEEDSDDDQYSYSRPLSIRNGTGSSQSRTSAQLNNDSQSLKPKHETVPTTGVKTVSAESSGSPSFSVANVSTALFKAITASCVAILILI